MLRLVDAKLRHAHQKGRMSRTLAAGKQPVAVLGVEGSRGRLTKEFYLSSQIKNFKVVIDTQR